ncbi:OB-fold domain-containing protein [Parafrankia sp. FMc6]|uniref:Zn-ribbon domain-containing OB-fold protein n=1 Tax=Parafrankia soli TaxID=2599596 RepID=UPI0034D45F8B
MTRSTPTPSELSVEFWSAAAKHRLLVPYCGGCGIRYFPPERLCPGCGEPGWHYVESRGTGRVVAHTVVHRALSPDFATPFVLATVEVDGEWTMLTNIVDCDPDQVAVGLPVRVRFLDCEGGALPCFAPESSAGSPPDRTGQRP